jgi:TENA/THI-4/PQQC family
LDVVSPRSVSDGISAPVTPDAFVQALWADVERHPAVAHPFLRRFAEGGLARWQIWGYASQHYRLVGSFTAYLEAIAGRTPDPEVRRLLRDILEDEYMRPQAFERSHPALYRGSCARSASRRARGTMCPRCPRRAPSSRGTWT